MPLIRAQVVFPYFTNIPTDVCTNTLYFAADDSLTLQTAAAAINPILQTFYQTIYSAARPFPQWFAKASSHVNYYNMVNPEPRVPHTLTINPSTATQIADSTPTEVTCVLSFQALKVSGQPQARRRGRIYLPAITEGWIDAGTTVQFPRWVGTALTAVAGAADTMMGAANTALVPWSVWSPTNSAAYPVVDGWIDNTPDTQRRRGVESTARTLWS